MLSLLVKARDLETTFGFRIRNEDVAAFCRAHAPRYIGFAGVDPHKGMTALRDDAERVLKKNFPDSVYLKGGPRKDVPWWQIWN